ncbi:hypothetical protein BCR33DRAFT_195395 [Rhizoclosmatium globosum]|uniref:Uncharacterized protein n=1 Tax=Rhizoclosmatium globosum TaxID=329046 RepID=A0A1Y2CEH3_9FUNG|nr:hypothetical protein BCR33DRAFT_195395 [Rhizoclosmatium globosum]|eukprot:ORY45204.1 hypothetical protein BCR33DRAFT_195395 [Rhizoclosmatium globosum]
MADIPKQVYHLPHADLSRLPPRTYDPFAQFAIAEPEKDGKQMNLEAKKKNIPIPAIATSVQGSMQSVQGKAAARLLNLGAEAVPDPRTKRMHNKHKGSKDRLAIGMNGGSQLGSRMVMGSHMNLGGSQMNFGGSQRMSQAGSSYNGSAFGSQAGLNHRRSVISSNRKVSPYESQESVDFSKPEKDFGEHPLGKSGHSLGIDGMSYFGSSATFVNEEDDQWVNGPPSFTCCPDWMTKYVSSKVVAIICFTIITSVTVAIIAYDIIMLGFRQDVVDGISW